MDDKDTYPNSENQTDTPKSNLPVGDGQPNTKVENTYWEVGTDGQQYNQQSNQQNQQYNQQQYQPFNQQLDQQQNQQYNQQQNQQLNEQGNPQFNQQQYQQFNQQQNQQFNQQQYNQPQFTPPPYPQPEYPNGNYPNPPKKKFRGGLVALITLFLLLVVGAGTAFAFRDTLMNTLAKSTKSPTEYYKYVEKNSISKAVDTFTPYLNNNLLTAKKSTAYHLTSDITVNKKSLDSLMQSSLGTSLSDLETQIGLPLDSVGIDAIIAMDGDKLNETFKLSLNQVDLITAEMFFDTAAQKILMRFPELSSAYLSLSSEDAPSANSAAILKLLTAARISDLLKRYSDILIDNINQVEAEDNATLSLDTLSIDCTKLTVTITEEDAYQMALDVLDKAKQDEAIIELLPMFNLTKEEYQDAIDNEITQMKDSTDTTSDGSIQMLVYVDNNGTIIGREIDVDDSDSAFGYTLLSKKDYNEYNVFAKDDTGASIFDLTGDQTNDNGTYDGQAVMSISGTDQFSSAFSLDISYDNLHTEKKNDIPYQYGTVTISSLELMGLQVTLDYDVKDDIQTNQMVFQLGADSLVTVDSKIEYLKDYEITSPASDAEVYDITTESDSYMATADIDAYLAVLSDKLGVDLQSLFNTYFYGTDY